MPFFMPGRNTLVLRGYDSIGVHQQIRNGDFITQTAISLTSIAS